MQLVTRILAEILGAYYCSRMFVLFLLNGMQLDNCVVVINTFHFLCHQNCDKV